MLVNLRFDHNIIKASHRSERGSTTDTQSFGRNYSLRRLAVPVLRLSQVFLGFSALWFIYWAHIYEMTVWNKTFMQTLSSTHNIAGYIISILVLAQLEYEARQLKNYNMKITVETPTPNKNTEPAKRQRNTKTNAKKTEYIRAAKLLRRAGRPVNEENLNAVLTAAGIDPDPTRVKVFVSDLED